MNRKYAMIAAHN